MKNTLNRFRFALVLPMILFMAAPARAMGLDQAKVTKISGEATYKKAGTSDWVKLSQGLALSEGDSVKTRENSEVVMELEGAKKTAEIVVRPKSEFTFKTFQHDQESKTDQTLLDVVMGAVLVKAEKLVGDSKFEVKTPTSIVGIRGTTFEVAVS